MGEIETDKQGQDGSEQTVEEETTTSENNNGADDDTEEGADADDNNDGGSDDEEETDDDEDGQDDKKSDKSTSKDDKKGEEDEDKEPPTRKRPIDFIKDRQERKKAKDEAKSKTSDNDEDEDADDDIDPEDKKTVGKIVNREISKALKPFIDKQVQESDEAEVNSFLKANPDFKPYEAKARKYMAHPSRKDVPIEEIFYGVAGKDLLKIGAKRAKIADDEAKKTKSAGGAQDAGGVKSVGEMSKAELEAKQAAVRAKLADR